jgi:hypothetical protein
MQLDFPESLHLTYCSKVHPGHGWDQVFPALRACLPELKSRLSPRAPFGLGLRLSAAECQELAGGERLRSFQDFLAAHDLYVFTLNGFPYGAFHGPRVKADVFAPDWREPARLDYTLRLVEILRQLLPPGMEGSISTSPLSYKPWLTPPSADALSLITRNLVAVAHQLLQVRERRGRFIHLDIEPEPDGLVANTAELTKFYQEWLLPLGGRLLADRAGLSPAAAREALLAHIQVCLDTCHMAVAFEEPEETLKLLTANGIRVGKVQITAGWQATLPAAKAGRAQLARDLSPFSRSPYLHQVVGQRDDGTFVHYRDLCQALPHLEKCLDQEWRIHYHLPLFVERYGSLISTRSLTQNLLAHLRRGSVTQHLEIETYTWDLLPPDLKIDLLDSLELEYLWVLENLVPALTGLVKTASPRSTRSLL